MTLIDQHRPPNAQTRRGWRYGLQRLGAALQWLTALAATAALAALAAPHIRAAWQAEGPPPLPSTMEQVDWHDPESSLYCLACHREVAPAMAGRDVEQGHPQNVELNEAQVAAIHAMGTSVGPGQTLICMSCHKLGEVAEGYMLPDRLADGSFCERCHPGHYARGTPHDLRLTAPDERNRLGQTVAEGGPCSACHLSHRYAREFEPCALDPDGRCITCHQMYRCAGEHPRLHMDHPESRCRECHDPHDMTYGEFLAAPLSELCIRCHRDYFPRVGMHPMGPIEDPVPVELQVAGAWVGDDEFAITCVVCHSTHRANFRPLLILNPATNDLCLSCHELELVAGNQGTMPVHGRMPKLDDAQVVAAASWGGRVGPGGELLCASCHRVHGQATGQKLLTSAFDYGTACVRCHPDQATVLGTSHDLRRRGGSGTDAAAGKGDITACAACHAAHGPTREPFVTPADPTGLCMSCHRTGGCAPGREVEGQAHPETRCTDCHDPHAPRDKYLVAAEIDLCAKCHAEKTRLLGGPHDRARSPESWPAAAAAHTGPCTVCHLPHGGQHADLVRHRDAPAGNIHDAFCLSCHPDAGWNAPTSIAALHPHYVAAEREDVDPDLVLAQVPGSRRIVCRTCHDPHGGPAQDYLARVAPGETSESLCLRCHLEKEYIQYTGHAPEKLRSFGFDAGSCRPCHAMHATPDGAWGQALSPRFLLETCEVVPAGSCVPCLACHHPEGPAPVRAVDAHPDVIMLNVIPPDAPGYLPLFNAGGHEDPQGTVACRTCHLSHGRIDLLRRLAETGSLTPEEQSALNVQVRSFIAPNVCVHCHGQEARARFLRYHDPRYRQALREQAAPGATLPAGATR